MQPAAVRPTQAPVRSADYPARDAAGGGRPARKTPDLAVTKKRVPARIGRDWTTVTGFRRAAVFLVLRSIVCLPVLTGVLWLATFAWTAAMPMILAGVSLGAVLGHRLKERTGLVGAPVTLLALVVAWAITIAAVVIAGSSVSPDVVNQAFSAIALGAGATVVITAMTLFDD